MAAQVRSTRTSIFAGFQLSSLLTGLVIGFGEVIFALSTASLIFSGTLVDLLPRGIGLMLVTAVVHLIFNAVFTSVRAGVSSIQDQPATLIAVLVAAMTVTIPDATTRTATVFVIILISTLLVAICVIVLGAFKLGNLVHYIPYPVIGGFIAGTGWLLAQGSIGAMADYSLIPQNIPNLLQPEQIIRWLPGVIFGFVLFIGMQRISHPLTLPGLLIGGLVGFFVILFITGTSIESATAQGLLLGTSSSATVWQPLSFDELRQADWGLILGQATSIGAILAITVISLLLNISSLELGLRQDIDLNRELRVTGFANLIAGLGGGMIGYPVLSLTMINQRLGQGRRITSIIAGLFCLLIAVVGTALLAYMPKFLLGGLLLFVGLDFLYEWVIRGVSRFGRLDYVVMIGILVIIAIWGFLVGVGVGLVVMVGLFVIASSRVNIFRSALDGNDVYSYVLRNAYDERILTTLKRHIYVVQLQGYMFFGTANGVLEKLHQRLNHPSKPKLRYLILDFRHVVGLDSSAGYSFAKLKYLAEAHDFHAVFTRLTPAQEQIFARNDLKAGQRIHFFESIPEAQQWCERELFSAQQTPSCPADLAMQLAFEGFPADAVEPFKAYLERIEIESGETLIHAGEQATEMYFLEKGQVSAYTRAPSDQRLRIQTLTQGAVVGELSFFVNVPRTASVIADEQTTLYRLTRQSVEQMAREQPSLAIAVTELMGRLLSGRLIEANRERAALNP